MAITSVTSKGQVTIPKEIRQQFGIAQGSRIELTVVDERVEMRIHGAAPSPVNSGFGMLKSKRKSVAVDLDPATLLSR